ncbi:MAG: bifunctional methylenetetrahydrofolate dehydrogenase/methenyltetrahydrofolate cyclohydrolase FolD [Gemmatimonas sp.]
MAEARIIDGKAIAEGLRAQVAAKVDWLKKNHHVTPGLAVVLVGEDPASQVYVRNKGLATEAAGMRSFTHRLPATASEDELLALIAQLNADPDVSGFLVQMPLPKQINPDRVIAAIDPAKDVDGFHLINVGRLATGVGGGLVPCTPRGCIILAKTVLRDLSGLDAVVVGRSNIVGKPVAQLLIAENCTVTVAHSRTKDLPAVVRRADLVVAAVGRARMIKGDWIKPGATVIDVGINRVDDGGKSRLVGDVDFESARQVAGAITPVPGGVGPMTIACLIENAVVACAAQRGIRLPS